jgi:hypothetical protein
MKSSNLFAKVPDEAGSPAQPRKPKLVERISSSPTKHGPSRGVDLVIELTVLAVISALLGYALAVELFGS